MNYKPLFPVICLTGLCFLITQMPANAEPNSEVLWSKHDPKSSMLLDPKPWQTFLKKYIDTTALDKMNRLRYGNVGPQDRKSLTDYLNSLQAVKVSGLNRKEQMAYWINLYNAKTVSVILDKYPIVSIRDIQLSSNPEELGPWDVKLLTVENRKLSLNDIEHRILRSIWKDNRVHFALNCASKGCPNLSSSAYTSKNLEAQLERGARDFINSPRGAKLESDTLFLSSIFDWYGADFGTGKQAILDFLIRYAEPTLKSGLKNFPPKIKYQYDWNLNEAKFGR